MSSRTPIPRWVGAHRKSTPAGGFAESWFLELRRRTGRSSSQQYVPLRRGRRGARVERRTRTGSTSRGWAGYDFGELLDAGGTAGADPRLAGAEGK